MPSFRVDKAFFHGALDSVILAGGFDGTEPVGPGWTVELPAAVKGHGHVPIFDLNVIQYADGSEQVCLILKYEVFYDSPLLEFRDLEGLSLELRPR